MDNIPVYVITGFLDGGKTSFLKFTLRQDYFNDGSRTLLILCEEGEVEYEEEFLKKYNCDLVTVEDRNQLNHAYFSSMGKKYHPDRVIIEYNGMWSPKDIPDLDYPFSWELYQTITVLDGSTFRLYLNNIKALAIELLTYTDMVIFNRCNEDTPIDNFNRSLKAVNRNADVMFEDKDGNQLQPPLILPYDISGSIITVPDDDYGIFYIDAQENPGNYLGKDIRFKAMIMKSKDFPSDCFVPGRKIMTCCEADIRFLGFLCKYPKIAEFKQRSWVDVTAQLKMEYSEIYGEEGPVLYASEVTSSEAPERETVGF
ncbi:MAG: GTP-binding protein [Lachnospiraceae bacterium]|jgi:putative membrane protein